MAECNELTIVDEACNQPESDYNSSIDRTIMRQGAEARLYRCIYHGRLAVMKERFAKKYRHDQLDRTLIRQRTRSELKAIDRCKQLGIDVPTIYFVDCNLNRIIMERIDGDMSVRDYIDTHCRINQLSIVHLSSLALLIGQTIAQMHIGTITHGDLTTSNMLLRNGDHTRLVMIDFGLSSANATHEDMGVDLYVMEKALLSTHANSQLFFQSLINGYLIKCDGAGQTKMAKSVITKLDQIRMRGRKRDMIG